MTLRVDVKPEFFTWAMERSGKSRSQLHKRFKKLPQWTKGDEKPTLKQLESFAKATYAPLGYFFLDQPPEEKLPIPDFRTMRNVEIPRPSLNLLDTVHLCQQRQDWYHDLIRFMGEEKLDFVGRLNRRESIEKTAKRMNDHFEFWPEKNQRIRTWKECLKTFIDKVRKKGIMVMANSIVGSNSHRKLDVNEFRGFALSDDFAPLIFINTADSKSAQMFTLAHELAHIGLGKSALSNPDMLTNPSNHTEAWCNKVAAEFLVPLMSIKKEDMGDNPLQEVPRLTQRYKVSSLVIIRRLLDAERITRDEFERAYKREFRKFKKPSVQGGGDFYKTMEARIGNRFAQDVINAALGGLTSFTDALHLLGIKKMKTFDKIANKSEKSKFVLETDP